jgi:hypothetical protein
MTMAKEPTGVGLPVPAPTAQVIPAGVAEENSGDERALFAEITKKTPRDAEAEKAFLASKLHMAQTHPALDLTARAAAAAEIAAALKVAKVKKPTGPVPGGVGYGVFYKDSFKKNWVTGTAISWDIICPTPPGGNVNNFLYLTATNRSGKGVEAFISYSGQNQTFFQVFDWARNPSSPWQTNIPFANLANYCPLHMTLHSFINLIAAGNNQ